MKHHDDSPPKSISKRLGAIILAGGVSSRLHQKCLRSLGGKPLILHVYDQLSKVTQNIVIVTRTSEQADKLGEVLPEVRIVLDELQAQSPLVGLLTGLRALKTGYAFATSCDAPFIEPRLVRSLFEFALGNDCAVPLSRGRIEPLVAVYNRAATLRASTKSIEVGEMSMNEMITRLKKPVYVPLADLRSADSNLLSLQNVNTQFELLRARRILTKRRRMDKGILL